MPDSYKELIKSNPDETEIRSFLVNGDQVSVTLRIPDTLRDAAKEEAALRGMSFSAFVRSYFLEYDEHEGAPYLAFFLQTVAVGVAIALVVFLCGQLMMGAAFTGAEQAAPARMFSACFACAAATVALSAASSVVYLKVLFWRDEHGLNTSGTAMSLIAVLVACVIYALASTASVLVLAG